MKKNNLVSFLQCVGIIMLIGLATAQPVFALTKEEINAEIEKKNKELSDINTQVELTKNTLSMLDENGRTLKNDLNKINQTINQLQLTIKANETNIDKLSLELQLLQDKKDAIEKDVEIKRATTADILRAMQQNDSQSLLYSLFQYTSLSDSISQVQAFYDIQNRLSLRVAELKQSHDELVANIDDYGKKKSEVENERNDLLNRKKISVEQQSNKNVLLSQTKNNEAIFQKQLTDLQSKQDTVQKTIDDMEASLRASFDTSTLPAIGTGTFIYPVLDPKITQKYGARSKLYKSGIHNGIDFGMPIGTRVLAADNGVIKAVDNNDISSWQKYQYGKYVLIDHQNGLTTIYGHLSQQVVKAGDVVTKGQLIGYSGNTGYSTGPHLHFGTYSTGTVTLQPVAPARGLVPIGVTLNPMDYL